MARTCYCTLHAPRCSAGLGVGFRSGHGILLAHLPAHRPSEPPRWSAPVFLKVSVRRTAAQLPLPSWLAAQLLPLPSQCWQRWHLGAPTSCHLPSGTPLSHPPHYLTRALRVLLPA
jgi:hypothetical protein